MTDMDDLLITIIIAGIGLSGAYLRAELLLHRRLTATQRRRELVQRGLHIKRAYVENTYVRTQPRTVPSSIQTNVFPAKRVWARIVSHTNSSRRHILS
jgi:hypothetical protein